MYGVYTGRFIRVATDPEGLAKWFAAREPVYVVTEEQDYLEIKDSFPLPIHIVLRASVDDHAMLLISNVAPETAGAAMGKAPFACARPAQGPVALGSDPSAHSSETPRRRPEGA
jgi:hypothetical protein